MILETVYRSRIPRASPADDDDDDDDDGPVHRVCADDQTVFTTLTCSGVDDDDDDFHRRYRPHQRLVAASRDRSTSRDLSAGVT